MIVLAIQQPLSLSYEAQIEIYDIQQGQVISNLPNDVFIQEEIIAYLENIQGIEKKINPIPSDGFMIRIPLQPPYLLHNEWVFSLIDEMIIIFQLDEDPILLLFDDEMSAYFFHFHGEMHQLLKKLDIIKEGY